MAVDIRLDDLKPYVKQAIVHGDFLLSLTGSAMSGFIYDA